MYHNSGYSPNGEAWRQTNERGLRRSHSERSHAPDRIPPGKWWRQGQTVKLFLCCLSGVAVGIGHHFYFSYLNGRAVENQAWIIRSGTAIAFFAKLLFSISVGKAFPQRVWQTLRDKRLSIGAVDSLFTLCSEASSFFKLEIIGHAKLATLIAVGYWSLGLVPILISGSISVKDATHILTEPGTHIQSLNFSKPLADVQYDGTTPLFTLPLANTLGTGAAWEAYVDPSSPATSFISNTLYGRRIKEASSPCGANCSFSQSFVGPAYSCDEVDFTRNDTRGNPFCINSSDTHGICGGNFDQLTLDPFITNWYMARNSSGDICAGISGDDLSQCASNATPWWDGKLWVLYQYLLPQYRHTDSAGHNATPVPDEAWERHIFMCQSYNATYFVKRTYKNFQQTIDGTLSYLNPINFTGLLTGNTQMNKESYPAWVIHETLYSLLSGNIIPNGHLVETDTTGLAMSGLVQDEPFPLQSSSPYRSVLAQKPVRFLREAIENLHSNITVGLLSLSPQLLYSQTEIVDVQTQNSANVWSYDWRVLVAIYSIAALVDVISIVLGVRAMRKNGGASDLGFARVVATTRKNSALDQLMASWEHGMDPVPPNIESAHIQFKDTEGVGQGTGFVCQ